MLCPPIRSCSNAHASSNTIGSLGQAQPCIPDELIINHSEERAPTLPCSCDAYLHHVVLVTYRRGERHLAAHAHAQVAQTQHQGPKGTCSSTAAPKAYESQAMHQSGNSSLRSNVLRSFESAGTCQHTASLSTPASATASILPARSRSPTRPSRSQGSTSVRTSSTCPQAMTHHDAMPSAYFLSSAAM